MSQTAKRRNQDQFGEHADNYVSSKVHATGESLDRLRELSKAQAEWKVLDVATGGGHTGLTFAPYVANVVASDLTHRMLRAARGFAISRDANNILYCQHDAEALPFASNTFDCITCRIAPHHFNNISHFVSESARVIRCGGILAVADNIVSGEPKAARLANLIDTFRDPSQVWAYSMDDWRAFFLGAGLQVTWNEELTKGFDFDEWVARLDLQKPDQIRLRTLLQNGPEEIQSWFSPRKVGNRLLFSLHEGIILGQKT